MNSTADKLYAVLRRDLLTAIRHRSGFVVTLVGIFTELTAFFYLSRAIGPGFRPDGVAYFPFLLVGTGLFTFFVMSSQAFLSTVQNAQQTGTLEILMTTSTAPAEIIILSSISAFAGSLTNLLVYLGAGVAVFRAAIHPNLLSCVVLSVLSLVVALALGIFAAAVQISFQKGSALLWLFGSGLWLLSGVTFPIQNLPEPIRVLARAIPFGYAIDGMRGALLEGKSIVAMSTTVSVLAMYGIVLLPIAFVGLSLSLRRARQSGTLSFY